MDVAELVLEYVRALAWPIVTAGLLIAFRKQIGGKIESLTRVTTPIGNADFDRDAKEVEELADRAAARQEQDIRPTDGGEGGAVGQGSDDVGSASEEGDATEGVGGPVAADSHRSRDEEFATPLRDRQLAALLLAINAIGTPPDFDIARNIAVQSPSASIMLAYSDVEKVARAAMTISEVERPPSRRSLPSIVESLAHSGLAAEFVQVARELTDLRNRVTHGSADEVSRASAFDFIAACERLAEGLIVNATFKLRHPSRSAILRELQVLMKAWRPAGT